ncbi:vacuolar protein sorting-associated protein 72 homolog [Hydractinia symbiolongicarpus]|uniref:vacuolar protein sorting-associated protein 72 homolog n=1 Tax=Hydractinia symbiolongicarpus TaxID=13093 RepID=UPI00254B1921|nr:vacuolar protein sorting-associated protein 72 homolog [Hydractinia symbiolongicarpus]
MATDRPKRSNAGSRMQKLIEEQEDEEDDFYKTTYGGFNEEEDDNDYEEEEIEEDVCDSDFSMSEKEDEVENEEEEKTKRKPKKKKLVKVSGDAPDKPRKPAVKRVYEPVQPRDKNERMRASTLMKAELLSKKNAQQVLKRHPKMPQLRRLTQEELLAEAAVTQEQNLASLAQFLKLEEEKKNSKMTKIRFQGPTIRFQSLRMPLISSQDGEAEEEYCTRNFLEFTDSQNFPKNYFPSRKTKYPEKAICVVTGHPAKYRDPQTNLPYASIEAFRYIRQHRKRIKDELLLKNEALRRKKRKVDTIS